MMIEMGKVGQGVGGWRLEVLLGCGPAGCGYRQSCRGVDEVMDMVWLGCASSVCLHVKYTESTWF